MHTREQRTSFAAYESIPVDASTSAVSRVSAAELYACDAIETELTFLQTRSAGYDWHWRLDPDSVITAPLQDPIRLLAENDKLYGYVNVVREEEPCVNGLWKAARQFLDREKIEPTFFEQWAEVSRLSSCHPVLTRRHRPPAVRTRSFTTTSKSRTAQSGSLVTILRSSTILTGED